MPPCRCMNVSLTNNIQYGDERSTKMTDSGEAVKSSSQLNEPLVFASGELPMLADWRMDRRQAASDRLIGPDANTCCCCWSVRWRQIEVRKMIGIQDWEAMNALKEKRWRPLSKMGILGIVCVSRNVMRFAKGCVKRISDCLKKVSGSF